MSGGFCDRFFLQTEVPVPNGLFIGPSWNFQQGRRDEVSKMLNPVAAA